MPRAGASQIHGHCQILMSKEPYAGVETLHKTYHNYKKEVGTDFFDDLTKSTIHWDFLIKMEILFCQHHTFKGKKCL